MLSNMYIPSLPIQFDVKHAFVLIVLRLSPIKDDWEICQQYLHTLGCVVLKSVENYKMYWNRAHLFLFFIPGLIQVSERFFNSYRTNVQYYQRITSEIFYYS